MADHNQLFPFERNRYYAGKLLTSTDFQAEQTYMNHKRRFINSIMLGQGIVCGLSVFNLDDFSIMVESGVAIDSKGREIVIETSVIKKLSAIDGFESLKGNQVTLCLRYQEEGVHPVYAVNKQEKDQEYEFNRISEGYQLFLLDSASIGKSYHMESEFYSMARLYGDDHYTVDIVIPFIVSCGKRVKMTLKILKHMDMGGDLAIDTVLQMPAFTTQAGKHEFPIHTGNIHLEPGETYTREYWVTAQNQESESTYLIAKEGDIRITYAGQEIISDSNFNLRTSIQDISPKELVTREIGKISLEMRGMGKTVDFVPLTEFTLVRTDHAYIIDRMDERRVKRYIPLPSEENIRAEYNSCFGIELSEAGINLSQGNPDHGQAQPEEFHFPEQSYAAGSCEISLGVNARKGMVKYSGEIIHGLGKGDVFVQLGLDYLKEDMALNREVRHTVYGDIRLFADHQELPVTLAETAVRVSNDKGSFVAAVKLLEDSRAAAIIHLRWIAVKFPAGDGLDRLEYMAGKGLIAETPTIVMEPGSRHYFNIRFKNMEPCSLAYSLTEEHSGEITGDGIYTSPAKEGIYEICIKCAQYPAVGTYAYAVVKSR